MRTTTNQCRSSTILAAVTVSPSRCLQPKNCLNKDFTMETTLFPSLWIASREYPAPYRTCASIFVKPPTPILADGNKLLKCSWFSAETQKSATDRPPFISMLHSHGMTLPIWWWPFGTIAVNYIPAQVLLHIHPVFNHYVLIPLHLLILSGCTLIMYHLEIM